MKFNLSNIMKRAWHLFRCWKGAAKRFPNEPLTTFSGCLKQAWDEAKAAVRKAEEAAKAAAAAAAHIEWMKQNNVVRMHYAEYKNNYSENRTVDGSYDKLTKTIEVYLDEKKSTKSYVATGRGKNRKVWFAN